MIFSPRKSANLLLPADFASDLGSQLPEDCADPASQQGSAQYSGGNTGDQTHLQEGTNDVPDYTPVAVQGASDSDGSREVDHPAGNNDSGAQIPRLDLTGAFSAADSAANPVTLAADSIVVGPGQREGWSDSQGPVVGGSSVPGQHEGQSDRQGQDAGGSSVPGQHEGQSDRQGQDTGGSNVPGQHEGQADSPGPAPGGASVPGQHEGQSDRQGQDAGGSNVPGQHEGQSDRQGPDTGGSNVPGQHEGMSDIGNAPADRLTGDSWNVSQIRSTPFAPYHGGTENDVLTDLAGRDAFVFNEDFGAPVVAHLLTAAGELFDSFDQLAVNLPPLQAALTEFESRFDMFANALQERLSKDASPADLHQDNFVL